MTGSLDSNWLQMRDASGEWTGERLDNGHRSHADPRDHGDHFMFRVPPRTARAHKSPAEHTSGQHHALLDSLGKGSQLRPQGTALACANNDSTPTTTPFADGVPRG